jgi:hypothetical protein
VDRTYYSQRIGRGPLANPTIEGVARALTLTVDEMWKLDYMQEWHGFTCVDAGEIKGRAAMGLADHIETETGWRCAWPLPEPLIDVPEGARVTDNHVAEMTQSAEDQVLTSSSISMLMSHKAPKTTSAATCTPGRVAGGTTGPSTQHQLKACSASA